MKLSGPLHVLADVPQEKKHR